MRQNLRDANEDYRNLLLGFKYGNIPSVNSLDSIYQFQVTNNILYYNLFTSGEADRSSKVNSLLSLSGMLPKKAQTAHTDMVTSGVWATNFKSEVRFNF